ncbi:hypothetical protein [Burkholderia sp. WTPI3]|uniref:hypothetical protein n=1 Tax=Burkholderia sp. WTPI3 TaxID=2822167 RepID=UPI001F1B5696|nr:hypothetical protein [Burkholderia sp. WTPI3]
MDENLIPESRPMPHLSDSEIRDAFERAFAGTRGRGAEGRAIVDNPLNSILDSAERAMGATMHVAPGFDTGPVIRQAAAAAGEISLMDLIADGSPVGNGIHSLTQRPAGETVHLDPRAVIEANSRCAAAGARIVIATPRDTLKLIDGQRTDTLYGFKEDAGAVTVTDPAPFQLVADGADSASQAIPMHVANVSWPTAPSYAFTTTISRANNRAVTGGEFLRRQLTESVLRGLGQLADSILLDAIDATTPAPFSLGAAAARNLEFGNLRALVGTAGAGATVRQDGTLAVQGIDAELTSSHAKTFVGAFGRSAVVIWSDLRIVAKRTNLVGDIEVTCFASMIPAVPDAAAYWEVAA